MMHMPVREVVEIAEVDWALPRPEHWNSTNLLGATRAAFFSGVKCTLLSLTYFLHAHVYFIYSISSVNGARGLLVAAQSFAGCHKHWYSGNVFLEIEKCRHQWIAAA